MLKALYTSGSQEFDISKYIDWNTVQIQEQLNIPTVTKFSVYNYDPGLPQLVEHAYVKILSTRWNRTLFSGFISSAPTTTFVSIIAGVPSSQLIKFDVVCTSDEYLLNMKAVQFIPAFVNQSHGQILTSLANQLCPGFFNTDNVMSGDIVPYFKYDPTQSWAEIAKTFADGIRYRYKVRDKRISFQPYGDGELGISYDESKNDNQFDPFGLSLQPLTVPTVNDVTIIGGVEAGNSREDYFIGDGFTGNFPLRHKVFQGATTLLLNDDWTEDAFDTQQWYLSDPAGQFNLGAGALNVVSNFQFPLGTSYLQMNNGLELAGGVDVEHGEFGFNDFSLGIIGGLYTDTTFGASGCLGGFYISSPNGVVTSASGAAGVVIQPTFSGAPVGDPVVTQVNHTYVLQTIVTAPSYANYTLKYRALNGITYGGNPTDVPASMTFVIQDYDIAAATGFFYEPVVTKAIVTDKMLPAFCVYALMNNQQLNVTARFTVIANMVMGSLSAWEGPSGLNQPTGLILPMLPPGSGGYIGPVEPWPSGASGKIYPHPLLRNALRTQEVLGNGFELQAAQITQGNESDTLAFYAQTLPAAGVPIRFQSWEAQASMSRLQSSGSIAAEASVVGDNGIRSAIVTNLNPLPRSSEDCDNAALAYLEDRVNVFYNGNYTCTSFFFQQLTSDEQFWPTCGRYLPINAPYRGVSKQKMLVSQLTITVLDAVGTPAQALTETPGEVGEVLRYQIQFGPDLHLEKVLNNFVDLQPPQVLSNADKANPPNPRFTYQVDDSFLPDVKATVAYPIQDVDVLVKVFDELHYPVEVRMEDANWGQGETPDYVGTFAPGYNIQFSSSTIVRKDPGFSAYFTRVTIPAGASVGDTAILIAASSESMTFAFGWTLLYYTNTFNSYQLLAMSKVLTEADLNLGYVDVKCLGIRPTGLVGIVAVIPDGYTVAPGGAFGSQGSGSPTSTLNVTGGNMGDVMLYFGANELAGIASNDTIDRGKMMTQLSDVEFSSILAKEMLQSDGDFPAIFNYSSPGLYNVQLALRLTGDNVLTSIGLSRQQYDQTWYMRYVENGVYSRRSKVIRIVYPQKPAPPTLDTADSNYVQFDFNGDIRSIYGFELRGGDNTTVLVQKPAESVGDLMIDLTQTANTAPFTTNRTLYAYFFNHQWSYSDPTVVTIPAPTPATLEEGYRFGQSLNIISHDTVQPIPPSINPRKDITAQRIQAVAGSDIWSPPPPWATGLPPGTAVYEAGSIIADVTNNYQGGSLNINVPATTDVWVRNALSDFISSGDWSDPVRIPLGDLLASDYLAAQGSAPPVITSASGGIMAYRSSTNVITVETLPFNLLYSNGWTYEVETASGTFNVTKDTSQNLSAGVGYLFYLSMDSASVPDPKVYIDGPYQNQSAGALAFSASDGRVPLNNGALTIFTSLTPTGQAGGGGGGSYGGGAYCGIPSSEIRMADRSIKTLAQLKIGDLVDDGFGGSVAVQNIWRKTADVMTVTTSLGKRTRCGLSHAFKRDYGWESLCDILLDMQYTKSDILVETVDGMEPIAVSDPGVSEVVFIQLCGPLHTYVLDGFKTHNTLFKSPPNQG